MTGLGWKFSLALCLLAAAAFSQTPGATNNQSLPVKRVVLYKNGVGYFEHVGRVTGKQDITVSFTSGQLNDVLKSLTVLDLGGGRITGVGYGSQAPADRQMGDLRLPAGEKATLAEFLGAMRGAKIEVRSGTNVITGRLLSIERKTRTGGGTTLEVDYLALVTDSGEVRTTELSPQFSVRLLERGLAGKVDRYLDLAASSREADQRTMTISTDGAGERPLFVSYISEVPVWKATYRVVLGSKQGQKPLLQGWAIVDNTVGQDWENVQLSLVAGAPQSFIQRLSQPYYSRRPEIGLPASAMIAPQTFEARLIPGAAGSLTGSVTDPTGTPVAGGMIRVYDTNGQLAAERISTPSGTYEIPLADGTYRVEFSFPGFKSMRVNDVVVAGGRAARQDAQLQIGSVSESIEVRAMATTMQTSAASAGSRTLGSGRGLGNSDFGRGGVTTRKTDALSATPAEVDAARLRTEAAASAQEIGDLFEYKLTEPISIAKDRSALVPIVQTAVGVEKVSVWNPSFGRPQRALWIDNTSGLTLDGGSFSVLDDDAFAGEGIFELIRPAERRLVSFASDLALTVRENTLTDRQRVTRCRIANGTLFHYSQMRETRSYLLRNEDKSARTVLIEHPVRPGFQLAGTAKPVETTSGWMRFRLEVASKQTASLDVIEARPLETTFAVTDLSARQVADFLTAKTITPEMEQALRRVIEQKAVVAKLEGEKEAAEHEQAKIFDDQQRLRENMKALKGTAEEKALTQRYTQQLNDQETKLDALRKQEADLDRKIEEAEAALDKLIVSLSFDTQL